MQFTIEAPDGTTTTETRSVSYYDEDEGTVYSIKTGTPGPSNVIVRADEKAREVYQVVRDELLEAA